MSAVRVAFIGVSRSHMAEGTIGYGVWMTTACLVSTSLRTSRKRLTEAYRAAWLLAPMCIIQNEKQALIVVSNMLESFEQRANSRRELRCLMARSSVAKLSKS